MPDPFSLHRRLSDAVDPLAELKSRREDSVAVDRTRQKRLVPLKAAYFFDPLTREVLRKVGARYVFVRHDRRRGRRLSPAQAENGELRLIQGGLFYDPQDHSIFQFRSGAYVLYSKDRRKGAPGKSPTGAERRKPRA